MSCGSHFHPRHHSDAYLSVPATSDPADGFPADATLSGQGGRCLNPSLPGVPASASADSLPSGFERREAHGVGEYGCQARQELPQASPPLCYSLAGEE